MFRLGGSLGVLLCLTANAFAADEQAAPWQYRMEFFASLGHGRAGSGRGSWGSGPDFGGGIGLRPFSGWGRVLGIEAQVNTLSSERTGVISENLDSFLVAGNGMYHFLSQRRAQPYLSAGLGYLKADYVRTCTACVFDVDPVTGEMTPIVQQQVIRSRRAVFTVAGGIKIAVHRHFWIRPEILGSGGDKSFIRYRLCLGIHF